MAAKRTVEDVIDASSEHLLKEECSLVSESLRARAVSSALAAYKVQRGTCRKVSESRRPIIDFCCIADSELCNVAERHGINYLRLNKEFADLSKPETIVQVIEWCRQHPRAHLHGSIP